MNKVLQAEIIAALGVNPSIIPDGHKLATLEMKRRIDFLVDYQRNTGTNAYVLGISGGVDSTVAGSMAQMAVSILRSEHRHNTKFIAVRLPYGEQRDEDDAQAALQAINPDKILTVNIKPAVDATMASMDLVNMTPEQIDFIKGNVKARQRMVVQYAIAGAHNGLVIGTDHAAEALMGFFTKHGDGAADIVPLAGLTKQQVRQIGEAFGLPDSLVNKTPTADLEDLDPGKPDEKSYGVTYEVMGVYLTGGDISEEDERTIVAQYRKTAHKRALPVAP